MAYYENKALFERAVTSRAFGPQFQAAVQNVISESLDNMTYTAPKIQNNTVNLDSAVVSLMPPGPPKYRWIKWPDSLTESDKVELEFWLNYPYILDCDEAS